MKSDRWLTLAGAITSLLAASMLSAQTQRKSEVSAAPALASAVNAFLSAQ